MCNCSALGLCTYQAARTKTPEASRRKTAMRLGWLVEVEASCKSDLPSQRLVQVPEQRDGDAEELDMVSLR